MGHPISIKMRMYKLVCHLLFGRDFNSCLICMCNMLFSYPIATIKANIDNAFEENKIRLRELEGLELCSEQIPIFGEEVFKQNGVHGAPAK